MTSKKKKNWGGKRPGAGRPGEDRVTISARVTPRLYASLKAQANTQRISLSKWIEELLTEGVEKIK